MNKRDKDEFREYIFQAVQAGKQETSNLVLAFTDKIKNIEKQVDDKAKGLEEQMNDINEKLDAHIAKHDEQMEEFAPVIKAFRENQITKMVLSDKGTLVVKIGVGIITFASVLTLLKNLIR